MNNAARDASLMVGGAVLITAAIVGLISLCIWLLGGWGAILSLVILIGVMWVVLYRLEANL